MTFYMYRQVYVVGCNDPLGCVTDRITLTMKYIYNKRITVLYYNSTAKLTLQRYDIHTDRYLE